MINGHPTSVFHRLTLTDNHPTNSFGLIPILQDPLPILYPNVCLCSEVRTRKTDELIRRESAWSLRPRIDIVLMVLNERLLAYRIAKIST